MVASEWMRMLSHNISIHFRYFWNAFQWYAYQNIWKCLRVCESSRSWVTSFTSAASVYVRTPALNYSETHQTVQGNKSCGRVSRREERGGQCIEKRFGDYTGACKTCTQETNLQSKPSWPPNNNRLQCPNSDNKCNVIALFRYLELCSESPASQDNQTL